MGNRSCSKLRCLSSGAVLLLLICPLPAQKKGVTLESLTAAGSHARSMPPVVWAPDGKRFAYIEENRIWLYDVPSAQKRELITLGTFQTKAVATIPAGTTD